MPETELTDRPWFQITKDEALRAQKSHGESGLGQAEVSVRQREYGPNKLDDVKRKSPWKIFLGQFADLLVLLLIGAAVIAFFLGESGDMAAILGVVVMNAILGFFQEYKAERAMDDLRSLTAPVAKVIREGQILVIPSLDLVPGDLVLLEAGSLIPADVRLLEASQLKIDESMLTGESLPTEKSSKELVAGDLPLSDQKNMAFKGTLVTSGRAHALVVRTGMKTELGHIAKLLKEGEEVKSPLQVRIRRFAQILSVVVLVLCLGLFLMGILRGEPPILVFMTALSLAVAAIPEALPAVVTMALALGARTMGHHRALIRKLPAVESLGAVTYICTDKTGTLTENRMTLEVVVMADGVILPFGEADLSLQKSWPPLVRALALNNDSRRDGRGEWQGDPTEVALLVGPSERGVDVSDLQQKYPRVAEVSFTSERSMMTTIHRQVDQPKGFLAVTKGAPERVLARCTAVLRPDGPKPINIQEIQKVCDELAEKGYRVLALAQAIKEHSLEPTKLEEWERELTFLGLVGLVDPPRAGVREAVEHCQHAGIKIMMITGDHPKTAGAIASRLGLFDTSQKSPDFMEHQQTVSGLELGRWTDGELLDRVQGVKVFARVAPEQKMRIVNALQQQGAIVAMTGDGVNDAPALRGADVGIAMGKNGTDVAREASDMILLDDHFVTIVEAVREGRKIYDNIRKFVRFALSGNSGEIWTLVFASIIGLPIPLLPIHILWINLVTDGLPGLALAFEPEEPRVMSRPPRAPQESIFAGGLWQHSIWVGLLSAGVTLGTMAIGLMQNSPHWQTMAFTVLTLVQMGHVLAIRSETESFLGWPLSKNWLMFWAVFITFVLQFVIIYVPFCQKIFKTTPLDYKELLLCLVMSSTVFIAVECEKWWRRRVV